MHVSEEKTSKTGNVYFDVNIKTSKSDQDIVRIMKKSNAAVRRTSFVNHLYKSIHISKISKSGDIYFYNAYRGSCFKECPVSFKVNDFETDSIKSIKDSTTGYFNVKGILKWSAIEIMKKKKDGSNERLREGDIVDEQGESFPVSIWSKTIDLLAPNKVYIFTHLNLKDFYGIHKLTTTLSTNIISTDETFEVDMTKIKSIDWIKLEKDEKEKSFPSIINAVLINCEVEIYPSCTNKKCLKKINPPEEPTFSCPHCGRRLVKEFLSIGVSGLIEIENGEDDIELTFNTDVLKPVIENIHQFIGKKEQLADQIINLSKKAKITYSYLKKEITKIEMMNE